MEIKGNVSYAGSATVVYLNLSVTAHYVVVLFMDLLQSQNVGENIFYPALIKQFLQAQKQQGSFSKFRLCIIHQINIRLKGVIKIGP